MIIIKNFVLKNIRLIMVLVIGVLVFVFVFYLKVVDNNIGFDFKFKLNCVNLGLSLRYREIFFVNNFWKVCFDNLIEGKGIIVFFWLGIYNKNKNVV